MLQRIPHDVSTWVRQCYGHVRLPMDWAHRLLTEVARWIQSLSAKLSDQSSNCYKTDGRLLHNADGKWRNKIQQLKTFSKQRNGIFFHSQVGDCAFQLLKTKVKAERLTSKQWLKVAAVKDGQNICREESGDGPGLQISGRRVFSVNDFLSSIKNESYTCGYVTLSKYLSP